MIRDLRAIQTRLELSTEGLARLMGLNVRTAQRYVANEVTVPEPTWRLLNLALEIPEAREALDRMR